MEPEPRWGRGWISLGLWMGLEVSAFCLFVVATVVFPAIWTSSDRLLALGPHVVGLVWLLVLERRRLLATLSPTIRSLLWGIGGVRKS